MQTTKHEKAVLSMYDALLVTYMAVGIVALGVSAFIQELHLSASTELQLIIPSIGAILLAISLPGLYKYRRESRAYAMLAWILLTFCATAGVAWLVNTYVPFNIVVSVGLAVALLALIYLYVLHPSKARVIGKGN